MALPLKAMAAGLSSLLGKIGIPGVPAFDDIVKNAANVAKAFGVPQATMKKIPGISAVFGGAQSLIKEFLTSSEECLVAIKSHQ